MLQVTVNICFACLELLVTSVIQQFLHLSWLPHMLSQSHCLSLITIFFVSLFLSSRPLCLTLTLLQSCSTQPFLTASWGSLCSWPFLWCLVPDYSSFTWTHFPSSLMHFRYLNTFIWPWTGWGMGCLSFTYWLLWGIWCLDTLRSVSSLPSTPGEF